MHSVLLQPLQLLLSGKVYMPVPPVSVLLQASVLPVQVLLQEPVQVPVLPLLREPVQVLQASVLQASALPVLLQASVQVLPVLLQPAWKLPALRPLQVHPAYRRLPLPVRSLPP